MGICEKSDNVVRPDQTFEAKLAIVCKNEHFKREPRVFDAFFVFNPERGTLNL
jgi:hypothetical protein